LTKKMTSAINVPNVPNVRSFQPSPFHEEKVQIHLETILVVVVRALKIAVSFSNNLYYPLTKCKAINFIYFAQFIGIVGAGFLAQPITQLFQASTESVWPSSILTIATSVLTPPISQAADYWGRKWFLVILMACGFAGSLIIAKATSMGMIIVGFCLLGISYGNQSLLFAVVSEVLPRKYRPIGQATVNITGGLGAVVGLLMGGVLVRHNELGKYRVYWYVVSAISVTSAIICGLFYHPPPRRMQTSLNTQEKLQRLDWIGYATFSPGITLFCVGLAWSQNPYQWGNVHILAPFIIGVTLLAIFFAYEWRLKHDGMLHHDLFRSRNFPLALATMFAEGLSFFTCNNYFPFQVSLFTDGTLWSSGLHFSVVFFAAMAFAPAAGIYSWKRKVIRTPLLAGVSGLLLFNILMATVTPHTTPTVLWGYPVFAGAGLGTILPIIMVAAQLDTPHDLISITSGLMTAVRAFGAAIGLAINNAIINSTLSANLVPKVAAATQPLGLPKTSLPLLVTALLSGDTNALKSVPGVSPSVSIAALTALKEAYGVAFRNTWITAACFVFVALIGTSP
jgi:MFS family permease